MTPIEFVLKWEGGLSSDAIGGLTNYGISTASYPGLDIMKLTREEAIAIYERDYYKPLGCDKLPPAMALVAFNAGVNCGVNRARKWLSASGGNWREFLGLQIGHYVGLKNKTYIYGWMRRTLDAWAEARKLEVV